MDKKHNITCTRLNKKRNRQIWKFVLLGMRCELIEKSTKQRNKPSGVRNSTIVFCSVC